MILRIVLLSIVMFAGASQDAALDTENYLASEEKALTRLRVVGTPQGVWQRGRGLKLESAQAEIKNVGKVEAEDIRVFVTIPGGKKVQLYGPSSLGKNKTATYTRNVYEYVTQEGKLQASLECSNCRR